MIPNFKAHPWHGISAGAEVPNVVNVFVEIVPSDTIKYEIDKQSGYLKVDRPQQFSNIFLHCTDLSLERIVMMKSLNWRLKVAQMM